MLRDQVFVLDHMYMSVFATCGWILRLRRHDRAARVDSPGAGPAGGIRGSDGVDVDVETGGRAHRAGT